MGCDMPKKPPGALAPITEEDKREALRRMFNVKTDGEVLLKAMGMALQASKVAQALGAQVEPTFH